MSKKKSQISNINAVSICEFEGDDISEDSIYYLGNRNEREVK